MIQATFVKNDDEDRALKEVLAKKGVVDFANHEYFNKEYWQERVRMEKPDGLVHAANIWLILGASLCGLPHQ